MPYRQGMFSYVPVEVRAWMSKYASLNTIDVIDTMTVNLF